MNKIINHLTMEEIAAFVTIKEIDDTALELAARVNAHMLACDKCREKVSEYQNIYDDITGFSAVKDAEIDLPVVEAETELER